MPSDNRNYRATRGTFQKTEFRSPHRDVHYTYKWDSFGCAVIQAELRLKLLAVWGKFLIFWAWRKQQFIVLFPSTNMARRPLSFRRLAAKLIRSPLGSYLSDDDAQW